MTENPLLMNPIDIKQHGNRDSAETPKCLKANVRLQSFDYIGRKFLEQPKL